MPTLKYLCKVCSSYETTKKKVKKCGFCQSEKIKYDICRKCNKAIDYDPIIKSKLGKNKNKKILQSRFSNYLSLYKFS